MILLLYSGPASTASAQAPMTRFFIFQILRRKSNAQILVYDSPVLSLFIAAAAAMIGGVLMKPEAGKTVKQDFAASAAVRDPASPVSAAPFVNSSGDSASLRLLKALPLPAPRSLRRCLLPRSLRLTLRAVKDFRQRSRRTRIGRLEEGTWCSQP